MDKKIEILLEKYIRYPNELSSEQKEYIRDLLKNDEEANSYYASIYDFYSQLDRINKPTVIELGYKNFESKVGGPLVLSAMTPITKSAPLITKATFASDDESTLIRILEDTVTEIYQIHVLAKTIGENDRLLLGIKNTGIQLVTNKGGKLKGIDKSIFSGLDLASSQVILRLPSVSIECIPQIHKDPIQLMNDIVLQKDESKYQLAVGENINCRVLIDQDEALSLIDVKSEVTELNVISDKSFIISVYR